MGVSDFRMGDGQKRMGSSLLWMAGWGNGGCAATSGESSQVDGGLVPPLNPLHWFQNQCSGKHAETTIGLN